MDNDTNGGANSTEDRGFGEVAEREVPQDALDSEDTQDERVENDSNESDDTNSDQTDNQEGDEGNEDENQEDGSQQPKKTEKGTKLDPNPKSAVHQQLANERRVRTQMEQVLASPELIAKFVREQYGIEMPTGKGAAPTGQQPANQTAQPTTAKWTAKDFESLEDVAEKFNGLQEQFTSEIAKRDEEIKKLNGQLGGMSERGRILQIADSLEVDVKTLSSEPELTPGNPEFIPGLEDEIGALYHRLDFDEASGMYRGNYSMREIGESIIKTARTAKKAGSQRAQTIVKDKTGGRIRTGTQGANRGVSRDELPPAQSIAQGISKMFK
jgi:hypothetical protein